MKKKLIGRIILVATTFILALLAYFIIKEIKHKRDVREAIAVLPDIPLWDTKGRSIGLSLSGNRTILIHYNSTCEHCQEEVEDIRTNTEALKDVNIVFISTEPLETIKSFEASYDFDSPNVSFVKAEETDLYNVFGHVVSPHIFIYNPSGKLTKEIKGEVKVQAILNHLQESIGD